MCLLFQESDGSGRRNMPEGYCVKCKAKKEIADAVEELMKNGRKAIKGKCPTCGVVMFKILGGKASAPAGESKDSGKAAAPSAGAGTEKTATSVG
jgi:uncharacterized Zn finger protein (UPF0148 family)